MSEEARNGRNRRQECNEDEGMVILQLDGKPLALEGLKQVKVVCFNLFLTHYCLLQ